MNRMMFRLAPNSDVTIGVSLSTVSAVFKATESELMKSSAYVSSMQEFFITDEDLILVYTM